MAGRAAWAVWAALLVGAAGAQDSLQLKDGRFLLGVPMTRDASGVTVRFQFGDVVIPEAMVKDCSVARDGTRAEPSAEDKARLEQGLVQHEGQWIPKARFDEIQERRRKQREARIKSAREHREWRKRYVTTTDNFVFEYTIDPEVMKAYADLMETYYRVFTKEWGIKRPPRLGRLKVCFYHDPEYYQQVTGMGPGVLGYFRFVEPLELNFYYDRLDPELTQDVMFHETNHYLTLLIDPKFKYPSWINESLAEYYGASEWDAKSKTMKLGGLQEGRIAEFQDAIRADEWQGLEDLIRIPHGSFQSVHYAWGWSFVHFLLSHKDYEGKFKKFFLALARDKDIKRVPDQFPTFKVVPPDEQIRALQKYLGFSDLKALEAQWHAYVKGLSAVSARGYYEAGLRALMADMPIKAQRFFKTAIDQGLTGPSVFGGYGRALERKRNYDEAIGMYRKAIEADPLDPTFYMELADALRMKAPTGKDPEVKRLRRLALEIAKAMEHPAEYSILTSLTLEEYWEEEEKGQPKDAGSGK